MLSRVLLVDPVGPRRVTTRNILKESGFPAVLEAQDAAGALDVLADRRFDVLVCMMDMPETDGIELTRRIRWSKAGPVDPALPVVLCVEQAAPARLMAARDAGASEFVALPIQPKVLITRLRAALEKPRPFVTTPTYMGPDRRRSAREGYKGPYRRIDDWHANIGR